MGSRCALLWLLIALYSCCVSPSVSTSHETVGLTHYASPRGSPISSWFSVAIRARDGFTQTVDVYGTASNTRCAQVQQEGCVSGRSASWVSFWFDHAVEGDVNATLYITTLNATGWGPTEGLALRPEGMGLPRPTRINTSTISFDIAPRPSDLGWKISVESDSQLDHDGITVAHSLMLFLDPGSIGSTSLADYGSRSLVDGVLRFGPGLHNVGGQMPIHPNVTRIEIDGGAWISGGFVTTARSSPITITGRGVISGSAQPFLQDPAGMQCFYNGSYCWALVNLDQGSQSALEGVVLHDPPKYFSRSYASGFSIRSVKMLGAWPYNTDGVVTGSEGLITDTFIRSNDDSIKLYSSGMVVRDTIVWQMANGGVFQLGWWSAHNQRDILVERVVIIHTEWEQYTSKNDAVFDLRGPTSTAGSYDIENITWRDIQVQGTNSGGLLILIDLNTSTEILRGWNIMNVSVEVELSSSILVPMSAVVERVNISNLRIMDKCCGSASAAKLTVPSNVNIEFTC